MLADRVVEFMYQQRNIAQCHAAALAPTRDENHFIGAQYLVMEQRTGNPGVSRAAEYQVIDIRVVVTDGFACRMFFHFKVAVYRLFIAERRLLSIRVLHNPMFLNYRLVWAMSMLFQIVTISPSTSHMIGLDVLRDTRPAKW